MAIRKNLALPKGKEVARPMRTADYTSKRGVDYWWGPEWVRDCYGIGRIKPIIHKDGSVSLYMLSKVGNLTYIQGSIQREFIKWHELNEIDYILLGVNQEDVLATDWDYVST